MTIVTRSTGSGLVLAEEAADEAGVARALRSIDDRLCLQRRGSYYAVVCMVSDQYAPVIFTWMDGRGDPLPLSSGLVEEFKRQRPEARERHRLITAEEHNERHVERARSLARELSDEVSEEHRAKVERGRVSVSLAGGTSKRQWQRNSQLPGWLRRL